MWTDFPLLGLLELSEGQLFWLRAGLLLLLAVAFVAFGRGDLRRFSPGRVWTLAVQTFRESVRKRVLLLIPAAMLLVIAVGAFQRSFDEIADIRQSTELCIRAASALTTLLVVLLAAFSFPTELESRTVYSLLSKPVTRLEVFLGKLLGLWLVALVVLGVMGLFSYGYLWHRSSRLLGQAEARLERQREEYNAYLRSGRPADPPDPSGQGPSPAGAASPVAPRPEPPDAALEQMVRGGLLTAMNYVDPARPVQIAPQPPPALTAGQWQWAPAVRNYLAVYELDLPPVEQRGPHAPLTVLLALPDPPLDAAPRLRVQVLSKSLPASDRVPIDVPAPAVLSAGWLVEIGEAMVMPLRRADDDSGRLQRPLGLPESVGIWSGELSLTGEFLQAVGSVEQIAVAVWLHDPRELPQEQLIGFLPAGDENQPVGLLLSVADPTDDAYYPCRPTRFHLFARPHALRQWPLPGPAPGQTPEVAIYRFRGIDRANLPADELVFQLLFEVQKGTPATVVTEAVVEIANPRVGGQPLARTAYPTSRTGSFVRVPRSFAAGGELEVSIRPRHEDDLFNLRADSVRLLAAPASFAFNLLKSLSICAAQALLVVGIGVMASVFLSWPVALLLTSAVLIAGNLLDVVRGIISRPSVQIFEVSQDGRPLDLVSQAANVFIAQSSRIVHFVVPDFTEFDPVAYIGQGLNIPAAGMANLWQVPLYVFVALVVGYLALHFKEVAK